MRTDCPVIGYVLNVETGDLKEVKYVESPHPITVIIPQTHLDSVQQNAPDEAARRQALSKLEDFGPFWS